MKELSLFVLDIAGNSIRAKAKHIHLTLAEDEEKIVFSITDDGCGMDDALLSRVTDPFATTRTTRKVGLGIPFLKMQAELTGGSFSIRSKSKEEYTDHGTTTTATFMKGSIDCVPLGDMVETICTLIHGMGEIELTYEHKTPRGDVRLSTEELREVLGDDIPLSAPEVLSWIRGFLSESYAEIGY